MHKHKKHRQLVPGHGLPVAHRAVSVATKAVPVKASIWINWSPPQAFPWGRQGDPTLRWELPNVQSSVSKGQQVQSSEVPCFVSKELEGEVEHSNRLTKQSSSTHLSVGFIR